jgi:prepilin-type processing-associated H-X9-DG protein/prepilin-type N-terminal cleavage/methylation domain-containing protein
MKRNAFTLVELLVVIGIVAVLVAILLPVLASVRQQSVTLKCLANLRICGQAFEMYIDEHKGFVPYPNTGIDPSGKDCTVWFTVIDPYLNSIANTHRSGVAAQRAYSEFKQCPLINNLFSLADGSGDGGSGNQNYTTEDTKSYKMNSCLRYFNVASGQYAQAKVQQLPDTGTFVLLGDGISLDLAGLYTHATSGETQSGAFDMDVNGQTLGVASCPMVRHQGACNILFVDGHAESVKLAAQSPPKTLTDLPAVNVPSWQSEYIDASGNEVWIKSTTPPNNTTATIAGRNPATTPLVWSSRPSITR